MEFFRPPDKRETMQINLRNIFSRMQPTQQDIQTLSGVIMAIAQGRKGPARGGVLDGEEAGVLRALLAEHDHGRVPGERGPMRGLSRLLRRNPTEAERALWEALTRDRRFAGWLQAADAGRSAHQRFRVVPRAPGDRRRARDGERGGRRARTERHDWLKQHDYRVVTIGAAELACDVAGVLDSLAAALGRTALIRRVSRSP